MDFPAVTDAIHRLVFDWPAFLVFTAAALALTVVLRGVQFARAGLIARETLGAIRERNLGASGQVSAFQATMISLCGTVGTGSIVGVTTAILLGGPGAVLWMWAFGLLGMALKFSEATLAVHFRRVYGDGSTSGGPFEVISRGLRQPWLGRAFAVLCVAAAVGAGNLTQVSATATSLQANFSLAPILTGFGLAAVVLAIIGGGPVRIARTAQVLFPTMLVVYAAGALLLIVRNASVLPGALGGVFANAFSFDAASSGLAAYTVLQVIATGVGRGIVVTGAGLGVSSVAHAQAQVDHPVRQGFWGVAEVLVALVVSTLTALTVLCVPDVWRNNLTGVPAEIVATVFRDLGATREGGMVTGYNASMTALGGGVLSVSIALFTVATMIAWAFYAEEAAGHLFGDAVRWPFRLAWAGVAFLAPLGDFGGLLAFSEALLGLMALPNLVAVVTLAPVVAGLTRGFFRGEPYLAPGEAPREPITLELLDLA
jgi:AGCS family alanine or glycine:cation symporter